MFNIAFTQEHLDAFAAAIKKDFKDWSVAHNNGYNQDKVEITFEEGKKYVRVVRGDGVSRSVHSFIEKETGSIWKAAGWKAPAKNKPRGNILNLTTNVICWTGAA